jgi:pimeloyl-ACP methyl ester carboxylesterase
LRSIRAPVLIVNGDADPVARLGARLASGLGDVRQVTLPGVDHFGLPSEPAFIRHAIEFLGAASDAASGDHLARASSVNLT